MTGSLAASFGPAASAVPDIANDTSPSFVPAVTCPPIRPTWLGKNVTGTVIVSPVLSVAGSDWDGVPRTNSLGSDEVRPVIVVLCSR